MSASTNPEKARLRCHSPDDDPNNGNLLCRLSNNPDSRACDLGVVVKNPARQTPVQAFPKIWSLVRSKRDSLSEMQSLLQTGLTR
jgi:hypothetical protein